MSLESYFSNLIERVESSDEIKNNGKDKNGFFFPTRTVILQNLHLLRDLHGKPQARAMVKTAWQYIVENLPPDWLVLSDAEKSELKKILQ